MWVLDGGIVRKENRKLLRQHGGQYLVGTPRSQLKQFEGEFLTEGRFAIPEDVEVKLVSNP